jgi:hypothetical protein
MIWTDDVVIVRLASKHGVSHRSVRYLKCSACEQWEYLFFAYSVQHSLKLSISADELGKDINSTWRHFAKTNPFSINKSELHVFLSTKHDSLVRGIVLPKNIQKIRVLRFFGNLSRRNTLMYRGLSIENCKCSSDIHWEQFSLPGNEFKLSRTVISADILVQTLLTHLKVRWIDELAVL